MNEITNTKKHNKKVAPITITITLDLTTENLDNCYEQLRHLRSMTYSSCMSSLPKYDLREQLDLALERVDLARRREEKIYERDLRARLTANDTINRDRDSQICT